MPDEPTPPAGGDATASPPAPPTTPFAPYDIFDAEKPGAFKEKYQEALPSEFDPYKGLMANYRTFPELMKAHKNAVDMIQNRGVKPITPESTPEEVANYRKTFGIPEQPYTFDKPEKLPDGVVWQDDRVKSFGEWAHKKNLTPDQANDALQLYLGFVEQDSKAWKEAGDAARQKFVEEEQAGLKTDWGGRLPNVVTLASRAAQKEGVPPEFADPSSEKFQGRLVLKLLARIGELTGESKLPDFATVKNMTPYREYEAIVKGGDKEKHALWKSGDKGMIAHTKDLLRRAREAGEIQ